MKFPKSIPGILLITVILVSSTLAGCGAPTPAPVQPTTDPATYVAAAVQTLSAQMTEQALRNPTATQVPTNTPVPTETPVPPTPTPAVPTDTPTVTATTAPAISAKFLSAGTFPNGKLKYQPNEKFGLAIRFLNTGSVGWQPGFRLKLTGFKGEVTVQPELELSTGVEPGKAAEFDLWAFGSEMLGRHIWYFQLFTPNGLPVPGGAASFTYESY